MNINVEIDATKLNWKHPDPDTCVTEIGYYTLIINTGDKPQAQARKDPEGSVVFISLKKPSKYSNYSEEELKSLLVGEFFGWLESRYSDEHLEFLKVQWKQEHSDCITEVLRLTNT